MRVQFVLSETGEYFLSRCGYKRIFDRVSSKGSYIRHLNRTGQYPRFHLHICAEHNDRFIVDLHYDVVRPRHSRGSSASENNGSVLQKEMYRLQLLAQPSGISAVESNTALSKKNHHAKWWRKILFGG